MNIALIIAGGSGDRMGQNIPKQFMYIEGCPIQNDVLNMLIGLLIHALDCSFKSLCSVVCTDYDAKRRCTSRQDKYQ